MATQEVNTATSLQRCDGSEDQLITPVVPGARSLAGRRFLADTLCIAQLDGGPLARGVRLALVGAYLARLDSASCNFRIVSPLALLHLLMGESTELALARFQSITESAERFYGHRQTGGTSKLLMCPTHQLDAVMEEELVPSPYHRGVRRTGRLRCQNILSAPEKEVATGGMAYQVRC